MFKSVALIGMWCVLSAFVPQVQAKAPFVEITAADQVAQMGAGVNILGYDP